VPNNIRDLLARERVGNIYIRHLAFLTYLGVVLSAFRAAGFAPIRIAIPLVTVTSGVAIMAFVLLGARAFNLFDPTSLSYELFAQLRRNCLLMTPSGYRWLDPSFQHHAHRVSRSAVDTLATLAEITATENHLSGQPFLTLAEQVLSFLMWYEPQKKRIPTGSRWYAQRYSHADWYQTGDSETSLAHQTASGLMPKTVGDLRWIEGELLPVAHNFIRTNWKQRRYESVISLLRYFDAYLQLLVKEQEFKAAFDVINDLTAACSGILFEKTQQGEAEPLERIGVVDALAATPTNMLLAYVSTLQAREDGIALLQKINWKSHQGIYVSSLPRYLLERLEWLQSRVRFEIDSEGKRISPDWYICELVVQQVAENAKAAIDAFVVKVQTTYQKWISEAADGKLLWIGAAIQARELEYWSKIKFHQSRLRDHWLDLGADKRIEGLTWPTIDLDELDRRRVGRERQLTEMMTTHAMALSVVQRPDSYPDFAGQFLHAAGEALFTAMSEDDTTAVTLLWPNFFRSSLLQFNRILARASELDWRSEVAVKVAVAPVLDLMDLSGYAVLFSELYSDEGLSEQLLNQWADYLDAADGSAPMSKSAFLAAAISLTDSGFEHVHRSLIRTSWRQKVSAQLRRLERGPASGRGRGMFWDEPVAVHDSPVVRVYAANDFVSYDGIDLFIEVCLRTRKDGKELQFGFRQSRLGDAMAREKGASTDKDSENDE
jgi:hypothetical protein